MTEVGSLEFSSPPTADQIFHGCLPGRRLEFQSKGRARHAGTLPQLLQGPTMGWIVVHRIDCSAGVFVCQGEESPNATSWPLRQMQPQSLNQQHVGEVLCHQKPARLALAQLLHHLLHRWSSAGMFPRTRLSRRLSIDRNRRNSASAAARYAIQNRSSPRVAMSGDCCPI